MPILFFIFIYPFEELITTSNHVIFRAHVCTRYNFRIALAVFCFVFIPDELKEVAKMAVLIEQLAFF